MKKRKILSVGCENWEALLLFLTLFFFLLVFINTTLSSNASGEEEGWSKTEKELSSEYWIGEVVVKVDSQNNIHYFWEQSLYKGDQPSLERRLWYRKVSPEGRIMVVDTAISTTLVLSKEDSTYPQMAIDHKDTVHLVWKEVDKEGRAKIYYCHLDKFGEMYFKPMSFVDDSSLFATTPSLSVDGDLGVHVVWFDVRHDLYNTSKIRRELWYTMLDGREPDEIGRDGKPITIERITIIDDTMITDASEPIKIMNFEEVPEKVLAFPTVSSPYCAVDGDGLVHLVWSDTRDGNQEIYYTIMDPDRDDKDGDQALRNQIKMIGDKRLTYSGECSTHPVLNVRADGKVDVLFTENTTESWSLHYYLLNSGYLVGAKEVFESSYKISHYQVVGRSVDETQLSLLITEKDGEKRILYKKLQLPDLNTKMKAEVYKGHGVTSLSSDTDSNENIYLVWSVNLFSEPDFRAAIFKRYYTVQPDFSVDVSSLKIKNLHTPESFLSDYQKENGEFNKYLNELKEIYKKKNNIQISFELKNMGNKSSETSYLSFFSTTKLSQELIKKLTEMRSESISFSEMDAQGLISLLKSTGIQSLYLKANPVSGALQLSQGESQTITHEFQLEVGEYYFYSIVDPFNMVREGKESNNVLESQLVVFNIYPTSLSLHYPEEENNESGLKSFTFSFYLNLIEPWEWLETSGLSPLSVKVVIFLDGEKYSEKWVEIRMDEVGRYVVGDTRAELLKKEVYFKLDGEELLQQMSHLDGSEMGSSGKHQLVVMLEPLSFESAVFDNFLVEEIYLPLHNDVVVTHLGVVQQEKDSWESEDGKRIYNGVEGDYLVISATLKNRGGVPLLCELSFYLDERVEDNLLSKRTLYLAPNSSKNVTITIGAVKGTHYLIAVADERNLIPENNEENNVRTIILKISERRVEEAPLSKYYTAVILIGGVVSLAAFFGSEIGKYKFLAFAIPLYTRLKKEEILDQFLRGEIYGYIKAHPGAHYNQIKRELDINNGSLSYHLKVLERERFIKSKRDGVNRRFYPWGMSVSKDEFHLSEVQRQIKELIERYPGVSQKEIAKMMGLSSQVVNYHIKILTRAKILRLGKQGRKTLCYVNSGE